MRTNSHSVHAAGRCAGAYMFRRAGLCVSRIASNHEKNETVKNMKTMKTVRIVKC